MKFSGKKHDVLKFKFIQNIPGNNISHKSKFTLFLWQRLINCADFCLFVTCAIIDKIFS